MAKRSITDDEIGLIKAMLARKMKNKDIQFFFNRPDRSVNSGRITGIRDGSYGPEVPTATDAALDAFIATRQTIGNVAAVSVPTSAPVVHVPALPPHPLDHSVLLKMFAQDSSGSWRLGVGETDRHECKEGFGLRHYAPWVRAVAALANNKGGYIFFGVKDRDATATDEKDDSYLVIGLRTDEFRRADLAGILKPIKSMLDPTPAVNCATLDIDGLCVGVLHVEVHPARPVIVRGGEGKDLREGDIMFRYSGSSERIKYSDLRAILDDRDAAARHAILPMVERLIALGPARALIADLDRGVLDDGKRPIIIDPTLLDQIKFIREGSFEEKAGAPALRLVGDVRSDDYSVATKIVRANITPDAVLRNFLCGEPVEQPLQYLLHSAHSNREWQPIWYYFSASGRPIDEVIELLHTEVASRPAHRDATISRLKRLHQAFNLNAGRPKQLLVEFAQGKLSEPKDDSEAHKFALAVQGLPDEQVQLDKFKTLLLACYERATSRSSAHSHLQSAIFRAACRLDELLFRP